MVEQGTVSSAFERALPRGKGTDGMFLHCGWTIYVIHSPVDRGYCFTVTSPCLPQ